MGLLNTKRKPEDRVADFVSHVVFPEPDTMTPTTAWERIRQDQQQTFIVPMNAKLPKHRDKLRFVCLSDTHSHVENLKNFVPDGDILLHTGNFTNTGQITEIVNFNTFLGCLPHRRKVVIAGNQDLTFDDSLWNDEHRMKESFNLSRKSVNYSLEQSKVLNVKDLLTNCDYLEDSSLWLCGLHIYGSPWIPEYGNSAFNMKRGKDILRKWDQIPDSVDVLLTHGPPLGYGDVTMARSRVGCLELLNTIQKRVRPLYHVFGHVHEGYGVSSDGHTTFINASTCTVTYTPSNIPLVFDVHIPKGHSKDELLKRKT